VGALTPLLQRLVDDAGLFPPSNLPMAQALSRFRTSRSSVLSGRFLCPAARLGELLECLGVDETIELHVVSDEAVGLPDDARLLIRGVEVRKDNGPVPYPCYVETEPSDELLAAGHFAKLRCGGASVPQTADVAHFVRECVRLSLPFKATAGLHAAVRGWETDERGRPHHGFLNLLLAVCAALTDDAVESVLDCTDPEVLADAVRRTPDDLAHDARGLLHSYGSCDTVRPVTDLQRMGLL
jgi:hypothetical protein